VKLGAKRVRYVVLIGIEGFLVLFYNAIEARVCVVSDILVDGTGEEPGAETALLLLAKYLNGFFEVVIAD
jgi:hypothetical protein